MYKLTFENKIKICVIIGIALMFVIMIIVDICFFRSKTHKDIKNIINSQENNSTEESLAFLEQSKKNIGDIEYIMKKKLGNRNFAPNELEIFVTKRLTKNWNDAIKINNYNYGYAVIETVKSILSYNPDITTALDGKEELKNDNDDQNEKQKLENDNDDELTIYVKYKKTKELDKAIEKELIMNLPNLIKKTINLFNYPCTHYSSFLYLFFYFLNKAYNKEKKITLDKAIKEMLKTDELGKYFKIYLFTKIAERFKIGEESYCFFAYLKTAFEDYNIKESFIAEFIQCVTKIAETYQPEN